MLIRRLSTLFILTVIVGAVLAREPAREIEPSTLNDQRREALGRIGPDGLKAHVSFLASDELKGRDTPSKGLDKAADYIAAQFRKAGLEPVGDDGYFQTARWKVRRADPQSFRFEIEINGRSFKPDLNSVTLDDLGPLDVYAEGLYILGEARAEDLKGLDPQKLKDRAVVIQVPPLSGSIAERSKALRTWTSLARMLRSASLIVLIAPDDPEGSGLLGSRLIDPESDKPPRRRRPSPLGDRPWISVHGPSLVSRLSKLPKGPAEGSATLKLGPPVEASAKVRNVVGKLEGSDPELKDEYLVVSAHYDHIGLSPFPAPDIINNGANDDASGTASVITIARALASMKPHPRRSILFVTFFGEEKGLLGSRYFGAHPVVPVEQIVAQINLEQVGRTDDLEGPQVNKFSITGFDYSDVSAALQSAGLALGVDVVKHPTNSDAFFGRSDNQALADLGIPAHTVSVGYIFPDYHGAGDHADRLDYPNMAKVDRAVALALIDLADHPEPPLWNPRNPRAHPYYLLWQKRRPDAGPP